MHNNCELFFCNAKKNILSFSRWFGPFSRACSVKFPQSMKNSKYFQVTHLLKSDGLGKNLKLRFTGTWNQPKTFGNNARKKSLVSLPKPRFWVPISPITSYYLQCTYSKMDIQLWVEVQIAWSKYQTGHLHLRTQSKQYNIRASFFNLSPNQNQKKSCPATFYLSFKRRPVKMAMLFSVKLWLFCLQICLLCLLTESLFFGGLLQNNKSNNKSNIR